MASVRQVRFKRIILLLLAGAVCLVCVSGCGNSRGRKQKDIADNEIRPDRPPTAKTLYVTAGILASQGKDAECEGLYKQIIQKYPDFLAVYNSLAELQIRQGRIDEAIETINMGLKVHPGDPQLSNNLGMCRIIRKEYEQALEMFTKASEARGDNDRYIANMAMTLAMLGRYDESLSMYKRIMTEDQANHNLSILRKSMENSNTSPPAEQNNQATTDEEK